MQAHAFKSIHVCVCVFVCVCVCVCTYECLGMYMYMYTYTYIHSLCVFVCVSARMNIYINITTYRWIRRHPNTHKEILHSLTHAPLDLCLAGACARECKYVCIHMYVYTICVYTSTSQPIEEFVDTCTRTKQIYTLSHTHLWIYV